MDLLLSQEGCAAGRICLVGAGNCNDVDLAALLTRYEGIDLIDWDADALAAGVRGQNLHDDRRITCHDGVDMTGIAGELANWSPSRLPSHQTIDAWRRQTVELPLPVRNGSFRTAASLCVLSQLVELCVVTLGADHPQLVDLVQAVRLAHLRQLAGALEPGGRGMVITDLVSSDTAQGLDQVPAADLPLFLRSLLSERNFFTGLHPGSLLTAISSDTVLSASTGEVAVIPPWLWLLGPRTYAVYAVRFRRR